MTTLNGCASDPEVNSQGDGFISSLHWYNARTGSVLSASQFLSKLKNMTHEQENKADLTFADDLVYYLYSLRQYNAFTGSGLSASQFISKLKNLAYDLTFANCRLNSDPDVFDSAIVTRVIDKTMLVFLPTTLAQDLYDSYRMELHWRRRRGRRGSNKGDLITFIHTFMKFSDKVEELLHYNPYQETPQEEEEDSSTEDSHSEDSDTEDTDTPPEPTALPVHHKKVHFVPPKQVHFSSPVVQFKHQIN